jgi:hypothetical protein
MPRPGTHWLTFFSEQHQPHGLAQRHSLLHDELDFRMSFLHLR